MTSELLKEVCRTYCVICSDYPQNECRSLVHDLVMSVFRLEGIEYQGREDAARIAQEIAKGIDK